MRSDDYWKLFMETGTPEYYLAFQQCRRWEEDHVSENTGSGAPGDGVQ